MDVKVGRDVEHLYVLIDTEAGILIYISISKKNLLEMDHFNVDIMNVAHVRHHALVGMPVMETCLDDPWPETLGLKLSQEDEAGLDLMRVHVG